MPIRANRGAAALLPVMAFGVASAAAAEPLTVDPFTVARSKALRLAYRGRPLIDGDSIAPLRNLDSAEILRVDREGDAQVLNVIREKDPGLVFRKEIALHPDGRIELTVKADYASFTHMPRGYSFAIPLSLLEGATFKAHAGRAYTGSRHEGRITADTPEGRLLGKEGRVRFIAFTSDTVKLVFDFNPYGPQQMYTDYPFCGEPLSCAAVQCVGDMIRFTSFAMDACAAGGTYTAKVLIYEGEFDYDRKHPYRTWTYRGGPPPVAHAAFGAREPGKGLTPVDLRVFGAKQPSGWEEALPTMQLVETHAKNPFANCVFSPDGAANTFIQPARPGVYVVTMHVGHPGKGVGPFDIFINDRRAASGVSAAPGEARPVIVSQYIRKPEMRIRFSGKSWAVHSIALQLFIQHNEDYVLDRRLWVIDGLFEPDFGIRKAMKP